MLRDSFRRHPARVALPHDDMGAYLAMLLRLLPAKALFTFGLMVCVGLLEWIGLALLVPLLGLLGLDLGQGTAGRIADVASQLIAAAGLAPGLLSVLAVYAGAVATRALLQRWQSIAITDLQGSLVRQLRQRLFRAMLHSRWIFFSRQRFSDLLHVLIGQTNRVGSATDHVLPLIAQLLVASVYLLFAFMLSPLLTLLVFLAASCLLLLLHREARRAMAVGERTTAATAGLYAAVTEQLSGLKTVKSYGAEERTTEFFAGLEAEVFAAQMAAQRNFTRVKAGFEIGAVLVLSLMLYLSLAVLGLAVAEILLLIFLFARIVPRFSGLQQSYQYFLSALPAFRDVMRLIGECEAELEPRTAPNGEGLSLRGGVRLRGVSFSYPSNRHRRTISALDLDIPAHRTTAIVGPSGAGKSTIADLVLGLVSPDEGQLLVDGAVLRAGNLGPWRSQIGYMPQDTFLFHDTIRANLLWAQPAAAEEDLWESLRLASADRFVRQLPNGMDAVIGDRGVLLSGGERQRIALARALLRKPILLILDEATSALDSENERQIQHAIESLHGQLTILVITHRLSTIREADLIHVLEDGRLVESGTWSELIAANARFMALCRAQRLVPDPVTRGGRLVAASA